MSLHNPDPQAPLKPPPLPTCGPAVRAGDGVGEPLLRRRQDAGLGVVVALPRQLARTAVPQPHKEAGHGVGDVHLVVAVQDLGQQVSTLIEPRRG